MSKKEVLYVLREKDTKKVVAFSYIKKDVLKFIKQRKLDKRKYTIKEKNIEMNDPFSITHEMLDLDEKEGYMLTSEEFILLDYYVSDIYDSIKEIHIDLKSILKHYKFSDKEADKIKSVIKILKRKESDYKKKKVNKSNKFIKLKNIIYKIIKGGIYLNNYTEDLANSNTIKEISDFCKGDIKNVR